MEFALLLPLFVFMIFVLLDVTSLARDQLHADLLARDAARRASQSTNIEEARESVNATVTHAGRSDVRWQLIIDNDVVTVELSLEPRISMMTSSLRWLGGMHRVEGKASFVMEYHFNEQ